jgi:hypothetical protein
MFETACCPTVSQAAAMAAGPSPKSLTARVVYSTGKKLIGQTARRIILLERLTLLNQSKHSPHFNEYEVSFP